MDYKDYYKILGVDRSADKQAVQKAYRRLARKYHPDVNQNDNKAEGKFKEINEAYEVLKDPEKRAQYDKFGNDWQRAQQAGAQGGFDWAQRAQTNGSQRYGADQNVNVMFGEEGQFSDFFETLFGRGTGAARGPRRGSDFESPVQITLEEAYHGTARVLNRDGHEVEVRIPAGVKTGSRVRISGQGAAGQSGAQSGDLYLVVEVAPDARFERRDDDLYTDVELPLYTAILGGKVSVPTLKGPAQLTIPPLTQNERLFRLRGKGMTLLKKPSEHGDLYARVKVRLPTELTDQQRALFEQLRDSG